MEALLSFTIERILGKPSPDLVALVQKAIERHPGPDYHWPGNVRELAQCVRRILLNHNYTGLIKTKEASPPSGFAEKLIRGDMDALSLTRWYCHLLYNHFGTYGEVARRTNLDRRTVKKYIAEWDQKEFLFP